MKCPNCGRDMEHVPEERGTNTREAWTCPDPDCETDLDAMGYSVHERKPTRFDRLQETKVQTQLAIRPLGIA